MHVHSSIIQHQVLLLLSTFAAHAIISHNIAMRAHCVGSNDVLQAALTDAVDSLSHRRRQVQLSHHSFSVYIHLLIAAAAHTEAA
jgi:hypothetical protein